MSKMFDCRIIRDLLPNYTDNLLSDYSKNIVEEHLQECKECKEYYKDMSCETSSQSIEENFIEAKKIKRFLNKIKLRNLFIGIILATIAFSIVGVSTWGWYKTEYLADNVVVPVEHVQVLDVTDNNDGTVYIKLATDTDYKVGSWKLMQDKTDLSVFILQMYHAKKADTTTEDEKAQYDGYSFILEATIVVDTNYHEENIYTGTYPSSSGTEPHNRIAKNKIVYRGLDSKEDIVVWEN